DLLIAGALKAHLELARAVAGIDEMRVAVDQSGRYPAAAEVVHLSGQPLRRVRQIRHRSDPGEAAADDAQRPAVLDGAIGGAAGPHGGEPSVDPEAGPGAAVLVLHVQIPTRCDPCRRFPGSRPI